MIRVAPERHPGVKDGVDRLITNGLRVIGVVIVGRCSGRGTGCRAGRERSGTTDQGGFVSNRLLRRAEGQHVISSRVDAGPPGNRDEIVCTNVMWPGNRPQYVFRLRLIRLKVSTSNVIIVPGFFSPFKKLSTYNVLLTIRVSFLFPQDKTQIAL